MKALVTLILVLTFGASALAQKSESHDKVHTIEMGIVLDSGTNSLDHKKEIKTGEETSIARLYKFKNARVKKALAFTTSAKAKMA